MPVAPIGDVRVSVQGVGCFTAGNNDAGFALAADVLSGDRRHGLRYHRNYRSLSIGEDQVAAAVILPVVAVCLRAFNDGGIVAVYMPAGDVVLSVLPSWVVICHWSFCFE